MQTPTIATPTIWQPELIRNLPLFGKRRTAQLATRIAEAIADATPDPAISVVIRSYNERARLEALLQDCKRQAYGGRVELIVVDNESTDGTAEVAKRYGAKVITIKRGEFTYPRSMNLGVEAAANDLVFLTVAHARLTNTHVLHAAARHFATPKVAGAFTVPLPGTTARFNERLWMSVGHTGLRRPARAVRRIHFGALGATDACMRKSAWEKLGRFDERYERGGEDTHLAVTMLRAGFTLVNEPAMAVYHDHGSGLAANARLIWQAFRTLYKPQRATAAFLAHRQKHLR